MKQERLMQVLVEPKISEKATRVADKNAQYVFRVMNDATKPEIKEAVEKMFSVQVASVQVLNVRARGRNFRGRAGALQGWKKAYVNLKPGFAIDFMGKA